MVFGIKSSVKYAHQATPVNTPVTVIIDPGHGVPDGGTSSGNGVTEADINLEISQRLNDMFHFLGIGTIMTRTDKNSIFTEGNTIAQKKISDTRNRVEMINKMDNVLLISIHQNHFIESKYSGPQVFYAQTNESQPLAKQLQMDLTKMLSPDSNRKSKASTGVYLMKHIKCTGVLIECGFLSNPQEEALLQTPAYQKKVSAVIAISCANYLKEYSIS